MARNETPGALVASAAGDETLLLETKSWRTWVLTVSVAILITLGLSGATILIKNGTLQTPWPYEKTEPFLIAGLAVAFLSFLLYATQQQRRLSQFRRHLWRSQLETGDRVKRNLDRLVAIMQISRVMSSANDPNTVLNAITSSCLETFNANRVSLMLLDRESNDLVVRAASGHDDLSSVLGARVRMGQGVAGWVAQYRRPLVLGGSVDPTKYVGFTHKNDDPHAAMVVPIVLRDELIGVLNVTSFTPEFAFHEEDVQALMVFGEHAGLCCRHAEQTEWMRQTIQRLDAELLQKEKEREGLERAA